MRRIGSQCNGFSADVVVSIGQSTYRDHIHRTSEECFERILELEQIKE